MEALDKLYQTFTDFVNSIVDYIKNLISTIRKFNDENT